MMNHIDISSVLRQTLACDLYSNLVTRPTGAAVRGQIELMLGESTDRALTIIDFTQVSMIDISCADEVVAKLLLRYVSESPPNNAYFLFRGVMGDHWDSIETVLERHGLALVIVHDDQVRVVGVLSDDERHAWDATYRLGHADAADVAAELGADAGDPVVLRQVGDALNALCRKRLLMPIDGRFVAVGTPRG
ncbi:MAG: hypothetical protein ABJF01_19420 [bacterium]